MSAGKWLDNDIPGSNDGRHLVHVRMHIIRRIAVMALCELNRGRSLEEGEQWPMNLFRIHSWRGWA